MKKAHLLTDTELRATWPIRREKIYYVPENTILTPSARDYLRENKIELVCTSATGSTDTMTVTRLPVHDGHPSFRNAVTGEEMTEKPDDMTHLRGNLLVSKTHPRIAFRGKLDSLQAETIMVLLTAQEECPAMLSELEEVLKLMRSMMSAEVRDIPLEAWTLFGMTPQAIRLASQDIKGTLGINHPTPCYRMGQLAAELNKLRTGIREAELCATAAFTDSNGRNSRPDLTEALNRLSSGIYLLFCRKAAGYYERL